MLEKLKANVKNSEEYKEEITRVKNEISKLSKKGISEAKLVCETERFRNFTIGDIRTKLNYCKRIREDLFKSGLKCTRVEDFNSDRYFKVSWY